MPKVKGAVEILLQNGEVVRPKASENNSGLTGRFKVSLE